MSPLINTAAEIDDIRARYTWRGIHGLYGGDFCGNAHAYEYGYDESWMSWPGIDFFVPIASGAYAPGRYLGAAPNRGLRPGDRITRRTCRRSSRRWSTSGARPVVCRDGRSHLPKDAEQLFSAHAGGLLGGLVTGGRFLGLRALDGVRCGHNGLLGHAGHLELGNRAVGTGHALLRAQQRGQLHRRVRHACFRRLVSDRDRLEFVLRGGRRIPLDAVLRQAAVQQLALVGRDLLGRPGGQLSTEKRSERKQHRLFLLAVRSQPHEGSSRPGKHATGEPLFSAIDPDHGNGVYKGRAVTATSSGHTGLSMGNGFVAAKMCDTEHAPTETGPSRSLQCSDRGAVNGFAWHWAQPIECSVPGIDCDTPTCKSMGALGAITPGSVYR